MLRRTFIHAPGVGARTERALWAAGGRDWDAFLDLHGRGAFEGAKYRTLATTVTESKAALRRRNVTYFGSCLPAGEHWRLFDEFQDRIAYVDIETTGLGLDAEVTVAALYDGDRCRTFVRGKDLDRFPAAIGRYSLIVTFNGSTFDLPFLRREFRGIHIPPAHIDLRYACARLGHTGGLKAIEPAFGVRRPKALRDVDGFEAIRLWKRHETGDRAALDTLLAYAEADVVNLEPLARAACARLTRQAGLPASRAD